MVCRVFKKSGNAKKYPSSNHARAVNPYSLEIEPNILPPLMMQLGDPGAHFLYGRNYMMNPSEVAEVTRVLRGGGPTNVNVMNMNLPMQYSHLNNPVAGGGGEGFTISGLNLNLGGTVATTTAQAQQSLLRPMMPPPQPSPAHTIAQVHHDFSSNMVTPNIALAADNVGYGGEVASANSHGNRYMGMDHCMDLDNYWPSY